MKISRDIKIAKMVLNGATLKQAGNRYLISPERVRQVFHRTIRMHYGLWRDLGSGVNNIRKHKNMLLNALNGKCEKLTVKKENEMSPYEIKTITYDTKKEAVIITAFNIDTNVLTTIRMNAAALMGVENCVIGECNGDKMEPKEER